MTLRDRWIAYIRELQDRICTSVENTDGKSRFVTDEWERMGGGGGSTRTISGGDLIEKGGVNTSVVWGEVTDTMRAQLKLEGKRWFAAGLSLVLHPKNPYVPTTHANWRYFELYDESDAVTDRWFGGGSDLTPYYLFEEDAIHFHRTFRDAMDEFDPEYYPRFKKWCDEYFVNSHRGEEMRGIGGVFYDHLRPTTGGTGDTGDPNRHANRDDANADGDAERLFTFQQAGGNSFLKAWLPIAERRRNLPYGEREVNWQEIRRGRYVEFNLIHDRGTLFGLKTGGRTESILMSLPPRARWEYDSQPAPGSPEAELLDACRHPRSWLQA